MGVESQVWGFLYVLIGYASYLVSSTSPLLIAVPPSLMLKHLAPATHKKVPGKHVCKRLPLLQVWQAPDSPVRRHALKLYLVNLACAQLLSTTT